MEGEAERFVGKLATSNRVLYLGGVAVISYGLSRMTKDIDVWLDPVGSSRERVGILERIMAEFPSSMFLDLSIREVVGRDGGEDAAEEVGVIRIEGLSRPLDVFRRPNQLVEDDFEEAFSYSEEWIGGVKVLEETLLILTKEGTGRQGDMNDVAFLTARIRNKYNVALRSCGLAEAEAMFGRYLMPRSAGRRWRTRKRG